MKKPSRFVNIQKLLTGFIDLVFPLSQEERLLREVKKPTLESLHCPGIFCNTKYLCRYSEPVIKVAVTENKFHNNKKAAEILGTILKREVINLPTSTLFIPVPLGKKRLRQRGHNQVETILRAVTPAINFSSDTLKRQTETLPQSQLSKTDREKNMENVFHFTGNDLVLSKYSQVVLVDDVVTTGATLNAARATLAPHLPQPSN